MARSATLQSSYGGDPLAAYERKQEEARGKRLSEREVSELGNRPIPEWPRREAKEEWSPARKKAEALFTGGGPLDDPKSASSMRRALESLFVKVDE